MRYNDVLNYDNSKVTIELRDIVTGDNPVDIWAFDYPSYYKGDEKRAFEQKVINHFYFRQLGQETVGRWLHMFRSRIREIMPYYLQMYKSVEIMEKIEDPFGNVDVTETFEQTATGNRTGNTTGKVTEKQNTDVTVTRTNTDTDQTTETDDRTETVNKEHRFSNTPQSSIANVDSYMTEASKDSDTATVDADRTVNATRSSNGSDVTDGEVNGSTDTEGSSTETSSDTIKHTLTRKGNQGVNTYAHDMIEFRQSFIDVDMMIINNLQDLFLMVY